MNEEPKKDLTEQVEETLDSLISGEQPQESSPATEQVEPKQEDGSDPAKTPSTAETTDKGFASHPAWIEREQKYKEAKELLKAEQEKAEKYSKLLDDPEVYAKWLKQQGFSEAHIKQALADKGYKQESNSPKSNQAQAIAERACNKLGWDITRLNAEQKAYINDSVNLTMAIIEETVRPMIDERVKPMEGVSNEWMAQKQFNQEESDVKKLASQEFPGHNFEEVIKPAIQKFLVELDAKDPQKTIKMSYEDIYYRATRPLLKELNESKGRQEVRDKNKANLRPLGNQTSTAVKDSANKKGNFHDDLEAKLDAMGIR